MTHLRIDFVSDVSCPWCVIGLKSLEQALQRVAGEIDVDLHFQPFELNPNMAAEGQDIGEHIAQKYGSSPEEMESMGETIRARGAALGFEFRMDRRDRIYNTFDAHRLLHWAGTEGRQKSLKEALFAAYFTNGESPGDHAVLLRLVGEAGMDVARAAKILSSNEYAEEVRDREGFYTRRGVQGVPATVVNGRHLISGGQSVEVFEQVLRQLAAAV